MKKRNQKLVLPSERKLVLATNGTHAPLEKAFLGVPTRNGSLSAGTAESCLTNVSKHRQVYFRASSYSNLECNYNMLLCDALNLRDREGVTWFAMLHDDIAPENPFWLDTLIDEAIAHDADYLSVHVPLKDRRGNTSTAMSDPATDWVPFTRLTLAQINHPDFPETVDTAMALDSLRNLPEDYRIECPDASQLLINTGCMVMRIDRDWMSSIRFHKKDAILYENGSWNPMTWTEDWLLARELHAVGARVMATRKVALTHKDGGIFYANRGEGQKIDVDTIQVRESRRNYAKQV